MYRVELKVFSLIILIPSNIVPNAPCGVESKTNGFEARAIKSRFLMYRMKLKE